MLTHVSGDMKMGCVLSENEKYRYILWRTWDERPANEPFMGDLVIFIGLNPSTADHRETDHTITKLIAFTKKWGYPGFVIINLFSYRSRNPTILQRIHDPKGPDYKFWLRTALEPHNNKRRLVVAMWGNHGNLFDTNRRMVKLLLSKGIDINCFGITKNGNPTHPLMLSYDTTLGPLQGPLIDGIK